jgi:NAD-dependent SIR2 family protein deacetylase
MSRTVFILGAGASKLAGAPLMHEFLDVADDLRHAKEPGETFDDFELVFKAINALRPAYANANVDLSNNIESVFAAFEMARLIRQLGNLKDNEIDGLPKAMRRVIEQTLEKTIQLPVSGKRVLPPRPYQAFADFLKSISKSSDRNPNTASVLTFNYDLCIDYALHFNGIHSNYCLESGTTGGLKLLKLHGSLNWAKCPNCSKVTAWQMGPFFSGRNWKLYPETKQVVLNIASQIKQYNHCEGASAEEPYLVPPTWNKTEYHQVLQPVWQAAITELREAEYIIVCGYSLPPTDQFFRFLYALGTVGEVRLKRFCVFDPDAEVENTFKELLVQVVKDRFVFRRFDFENAISQIYTILNMAPK